MHTKQALVCELALLSKKLADKRCARTRVVGRSAAICLSPAWPAGASYESHMSRLASNLFILRCGALLAFIACPTVRVRSVCSPWRHGCSVLRAVRMGVAQAVGRPAPRVLDCRVRACALEFPVTGAYANLAFYDSHACRVLMSTMPNTGIAEHCVAVHGCHARLLHRADGHCVDTHHCCPAWQFNWQNHVASVRRCPRRCCASCRGRHIGCSRSCGCWRCAACIPHNWR